ncbi:MAG: leucine-rich repeat protein [Clostridia bacterium]|nr:leucine-rich repeat protein [Clostridia bacterium]
MKKLRTLIIALLICIIAQPLSLAAPRIPVYKVNNVLYFFDKSSGTITGFAGEPKDLIIPLSLGGYSVVSIGPRAFLGSTTLETLSIPDGISTVSSEAFASCPNLTSVEIGMTVSYVGNRAFADCKNLSNVTFKGLFDNIESDAFINTAWLTSSSAEFVMLAGTLVKYNGNAETVTIPEGVTSIAESAFSYNANIKEVILPSTLQKIGDNAFVHCYSLEKITIPPTVSHIGAGAFDDTVWMYNQKNDYICVNGILISYKGTDKHLELPEGITAIGSGAFMANTNLLSVHLPDSIIYIDSMAFGGCSELRTLNIPDSVEWIDEYSFAGCVNLTLYGRQHSYCESYAQYMQMPFSTEVYVSYNGKKVYFDNAVPIIYYERTYLPLRTLMEIMGYSVTWDSETKTVICSLNDRIVTVNSIGEITVNGVLSPTVAPPININGSNLVSARVIAEAVNAKVFWNDATRTVEITY